MHAGGLQERGGSQEDHVREEPPPFHHRTRRQRCQAVRAFLVGPRGKGPWPVRGWREGAKEGTREGGGVARLRSSRRRTWRGCGSAEGGIPNGIAPRGPRAFSVAPSRSAASGASRWGGDFFSYNPKRAWVPSFFKRNNSSLLVPYLGKPSGRFFQLRSFCRSPSVQSDQLAPPPPPFLGHIPSTFWPTFSRSSQVTAVIKRNSMVK